MNEAAAQRRIREFKRRFGGDLRLAMHAALPVALTPELVNLLRVNFLEAEPDPPRYTAESDLLLSSLCRELSDELYEIEPAVRDLLLRELAAQYGPGHIRDIARLLWEYTVHRAPWADQPLLERAQQLTALSFIDPEAAARWMAGAGTELEGAETEHAWFVALEGTLARLREAVAGEVLEAVGVEQGAERGTIEPAVEGRAGEKGDTDTAPLEFTHLIRFEAWVGDHPGVVERSQALQAIAPRLPAEELHLSLLSQEPPIDPMSGYQEGERRIVREVRGFLSRILHHEVHHLSIFGFGPSPLLMVLGREIGDKLPAVVYFYHQDTGDWRWKGGIPKPLRLEMRTPQGRPRAKHVAVLLSVGGDVQMNDVRIALETFWGLGTEDVDVYELRVREPGPGQIRFESQVRDFAGSYRGLLSRVRAIHGSDCRIHLFPALPLPLAIECGRQLTQADPAIDVYDWSRSEHRIIFALTLHGERRVPRFYAQKQRTGEEGRAEWGAGTQEDAEQEAAEPVPLQPAVANPADTREPPEVSMEAQEPAVLEANVAVPSESPTASPGAPRPEAWEFLQGTADWFPARLRLLRRALVQLYPSQAQQRMLAEDAGLEPRRMALEGSAEVCWFNVLQAAMEEHRLGALVRRVLEDYPENVALGAALRPDLPDSRHPPERGRARDWSGQDLRELRRIFAQLYPEPDQQRMVLFDAGIPLERFVESGSPEQRWQAPLEEALRHGVIELLIRDTIERYPASTHAVALRRFLDGKPVAESEPRIRVLPGARREMRRMLAALYPSSDAQAMFVDDLGLDSGRVDFRGGPEVVWARILEEAERSGRIGALLEEASLQFPEHPELRRLRNGLLHPETTGQAVERNDSPGTVPELSRLRSLLVRLYRDPSMLRLLVMDAGLNPAYIDFTGPLELQCLEVLRAAERNGQLEDLVRIVLKDHPNHPEVRALLGGSSPAAPSPLPKAQPRHPRPERGGLLIAYHRADRRWAERFQLYLKPLMPESSVTVWDDGRLQWGGGWREELESTLTRVKAVLLLLSADFLASDFGRDDEWLQMLEVQRASGLLVCWVVVEACDFRRSPFTSDLVLNDPGTPLASLRSTRREEVMVKLCSTLRDLVEPRPRERAIKKSPPAQVAFPFTAESARVLVFAASPRDEAPLQVQTELRDIQRVFRMGRASERFAVELHPAARIEDVRAAFQANEHSVLVHFSGHGAGEQGLIFEDDKGETQLVSNEMLIELFSSNPHLNLVFLNTDRSDIQGRSILPYADFVVVRRGMVTDGEALTFARAFYSAVAHGRPIEQAFEQAQAATRAEGFAEADNYILLRRENSPA